MRLGVTDRKQIDRIRIKFHELDIKRNNVLDYDELCHGGYLMQSHSHAHGLNSKNEQEFLHLSGDTSSPFHDEENGTAGAAPDHLPVPTKEEEQYVRDEIKEEIYQMQRNRAASIVRLETLQQQQSGDSSQLIELP